MKNNFRNASVHQGKWINDDSKRNDTSSDPLAIEAFDHVEIFAGNARQAAYHYSSGMGFTPVAYRGPETGYRDAATYVLKQADVTLLLTTPLRITHPISSFVHLHGDSVGVTAFRVPDCEAFYHEAMKRGAVSVEPPQVWEDNSGIVKKAVIKTYGDVVHAIVERGEYGGEFWPGYESFSTLFPGYKSQSDVGILSIDHIVGNVELGEMQTWVDFYEKVLGFVEYQHFSDDDISTEYSALMSKVVANGSGKIKMPINEPADGKNKSQIEEYLEFHNGPGVQHVAFESNDIIKTITELKKRGVGFLNVPQTYYDEVPARVGTIEEDMATIAELGILVDRDEDGYLLQLFTNPVQDRPTLFFEIIQRKGSKGFGIGNFKALFEAIEREQAKRGNL